MKILAVIPARMGSSRFPGKPMVPILGKPMIGHVYERAVSYTHLDVYKRQVGIPGGGCGHRHRAREIAAADQERRTGVA